MTTLENLVKEEQKKDRLCYFLVDCEFCHKTLVVSEKDITIDMFEPVEKEVEAIRVVKGDDGTIRHEECKEKILLTSDPTKDSVTFVCCNCGHRQTMLRKDLYANRCNRFGNNDYTIKFTEAETESMKAFIQEHSDCCKKKLNKALFSSTGGQFSLNVTPTSLGNCITVKCNACGESKDITDIESW